MKKQGIVFVAFMICACDQSGARLNSGTDSGSATPQTKLEAADRDSQSSTVKPATAASTDHPPGCTAIDWNDYSPWVPEYTRYKHCNPITVTTNNEVISGCKFAPCYGGSSCTAITIVRGVTGVQIRDNLIQGYYGGTGIVAEGENDGLYIHRNYFTEFNGRSINIYNTREVAVQNNRFHNLRGTGVNASAILLNGSVGKRIDISWNRVLLKPANVSGGGSWTNDVFSIYESGGTSPTEKLKIEGNIIVGGHAGMEHGDGIVVGDGCRKGNHVLVKNNKLINSGLTGGITGSGGSDYLVEGNTIYSCPSVGREEWGAFRAGQQHSWVPDGCTRRDACDNVKWSYNKAHVRGIGTFGTPWNELLDFGIGTGDQYVSCQNVIQTGNQWKNASLTPDFVEKDFMNWCETSLHCPADFTCSLGRCQK